MVVHTAELVVPMMKAFDGTLRELPSGHVLERALVIAGPKPSPVPLYEKTIAPALEREAVMDARSERVALIFATAFATAERRKVTPGSVIDSAA